QDDAPRFLNATRKTMSTLAFTLIPISFLAICVAKPGFIYFLTDKWIPSIPIFQILCLASIFTSLTDLNVNFLNIKGSSKFFLRLEIIKVSLAILFLFLTYQNGLLMIAVGLLTVRVICFIIAAIMSGKVYGYQIWMQAKDLLPTVL